MKKVHIPWPGAVPGFPYLASYNQPVGQERNALTDKQEEPPQA